MDDLASLRARLEELCGKVDAFAARVQRAHAAEMSCGPGCDGCCRAHLTVTPLEAAAIDALLVRLPVDVRASLRARAAAVREIREARAGEPAPAVRCVALDDDGRCAVYAARPLVCRSHGLPIRTRGARGLPVVSACALNFPTHGPSAVEPGSILDQETLSTVLFALDAALAKLRDTPPGARVHLVTLFAT